MGGIVAESQRRVGPVGHRTPFERNLLPNFAAWTVEQIDRYKPDYLVPVETKGVHVLDAALAYARQTLGVTVTTPVLYTSGLAYRSADELRESRVMVVDDAMKSGANLGRSIQEIKAHGVSEASAIVFMGTHHVDTSSPDLQADCYLRVKPTRYTQYLWQLTELVVARGLPPEVDHSVYELRLEGRLTPAWQRLQALLAPYGTLTIDGPGNRADQIQPMTLHFPLLPGMPRVPAGADGPDKVRFFPDPDGRRIFVVPISFPAVTFGPHEAGEIDEVSAVRVLHRATRGRSRAGELLISRAHTLNPLTVFRAVSTARELGIVRGVARLLAGAMPESRLISHRDVFDRLFGEAIGAELGAIVREELAQAVGEKGTKASGRRAQRRGNREPIFLDAGVAEATDRLAMGLKERSEHARVEPLTGELVGMSMPQLAAELPQGGRLLASRCVTHGLAATTLAPFISSVTADDGSLKVERQYRVSEPIRDQPYRDLDLVRKEKSEQALAVICKRLRERSERLADQPVPLELATNVVAILHPLVLREQSIHLAAQPTSAGVSLVLLDTVQPIMVSSDQPSRYYTLDDRSRIVTSPDFERQYAARELDLDIDGSTEAIETHVDELAGLIDALEDDQVGRVLESWAMCTDMRLGLTHVRSSLEQALKEMRRPLAVILSSENPERSAGLIGRVQTALDDAHRKLELLSGDWSSAPRARWGGGAGRREQRMLAALGAPERQATMYTLARALTEVLAGAALLVEMLDVASNAAWRDPDGDDARETASSVLEWAARIRRALIALSGDDGTLPSVPTGTRDAVTMAAEDLLGLLERLTAMGAALAGVFRGDREGRQQATRDRSGRHLSILYLDIAGYTEHGEACDERSHNSWARAGLDLAAQWTRAFGGRERPERRGDDIVVEFAEDGDATVLAAAVVQSHTRALRSTGIDGIAWRFHAGVDCGAVEEQHGDVFGRCLNRAAKIAKRGDGKTDASLVILTQEARERCSPDFRETPIAELGESVSLGEGEQYEVRPVTVSSAPVLTRYVGRLRDAAGRLATDLQRRPAEEPAVSSVPVDDQEQTRPEAAEET